MTPATAATTAATRTWATTPPTSSRSSSTASPTVASHPRSAWSRSAGRTATPVSFPYSELRQVGTVNLDFEGRPTVVLWAPGAASALDRQFIDEGEDVGATGVFSAVVDGQTLTFERGGGEDAAITDAETGSTWDITGHAIDGPLAGTSLEPLNHGDHFWFAWAAFVPHTDIWTTEGVLLARTRRPPDGRGHRSPGRIGLGLPPAAARRALRAPRAGDRRRCRHRRQPPCPAGARDLTSPGLVPAARGRAHGPAAATSRRTACEFKGEASYFDIAAGGRERRDAAWTYPARCLATRPSPATSRSIRDGSMRPGWMAIASRRRPATSTAAGSRRTSADPSRAVPARAAGSRATARRASAMLRRSTAPDPPLLRNGPGVRGPVVPRWGAHIVRAGADSLQNFP